MDADRDNGITCNVQGIVPVLCVRPGNFSRLCSGAVFLRLYFMNTSRGGEKFPVDDRGRFFDSMRSLIRG